MTKPEKPDEWESMTRLSWEWEWEQLKQAGENGMPLHEFQERMTRLSWEWEQLKEIEEQLRKQKPE